VEVSREIRFYSIEEGLGQYQHTAQDFKRHIKKKEQGL